MSEQVRVATLHRRAVTGLLILAFVVFVPGFAKGQCKEPANPAAEVPAADLNRRRLAAAGALPQGNAQRAAAYAKAAGQPPANVMMYKPPRIPVPDLSNKTLDEVKAEVADKLTIRTINNNNPGWIVERQFPARGSYVPVCFALELWMKERPQKITKVPPIAGVPENQIASLLEKNHLRYGGWTPKETNTATPGTIFDQDPKPGTPEPWGKEVIAYRAQSPPAVVPLSVTLAANRMSVKPGETVTFVAKLQPDSPDAQYIFNFNDGSSPVPGGSEMPHQFAQDGDFEVSVTATVGEKQAQSEPIHITVHPTEYPIELSWEPQHPRAGQNVTFTARTADPAVGKGPFYFYFGNKEKPKPSADVYSRAFEKPGTYLVSVMVKGEHGHTVKSNSMELVVVVPPPTPPNWREKWGKSVVPAGAVALLCTFAGLYVASKYLTGLVGLRAAGKAGGVSLRQDGSDGLEAAFGFRLEQPVVTATPEFRGTVIRKVERVV